MYTAIAMPMQLGTRKGQGSRLIGLSICDSEPTMLCAYCFIYAIDQHAGTVLELINLDGSRALLLVENIEPRQEFLARVLM